MPTSITHLSVWVALAFATLGVSLRFADGRPGWLKGARWAWTIGCACFLVHVAAAFSTFHHWSHQAAYDAVARQTNDFAGLNWGGGIYFNYVFAAAWLLDVVWWWSNSQSFMRRPPWVEIAWNGFFFFMTVNGAVVFVHGPTWWLGVALCAVLAVCWWRAFRRNIPKIGSAPTH